MNVQMQNNIEPMVVDASNEENDGQEEEPVVVHSATLDLDSLSSTYVGLGRIYRLMFVADHCPPLKEEALRLALNHVESTCNVTMYQKIQQKLSESSLLAQAAGGNLPDVAAAGPSASGAAVSLQWTETKNKKAALKLEKLDSELKTSKVNSIKESVRRGHDELGDHYLDCGELSNALKCYTRARDYCTSHMHILEFCLNVVKVSIYLQNWSHVQSYVQKAHNTTSNTDSKTPTVAAKEQLNVVQTKLHCAAGLADLATKKYKSSAKHFLRAQLDSCEFSCVLSPYNVALYGGLCALATFSRQELHKLLIMNSSFKQFLELEPQLRDVIFKFYESKYAQCLKILDSMKDNLLLDMYLSPHVNTLYTRIRSRGLVQYFSPYKSATLHRMASAFNTTVPCLENELSVLILDGHMQARIDSHKKIVYAAVVDERLETFANALEMGQENMDRLHTLILRAALMRNQLMVKPSSREGHSALGVVGGEAQVGQDNQSS